MLGGCGDTNTGPVSDNSNESILDFEGFKASVHQRTDGTFIVDGDLPIKNEQELRIYFNQTVLGSLPRSIVNLTNSGIDVWNPTQAMNLTYCVSLDFGANYFDVVNAMNAAAADFQNVTNVRFFHNITQDSACTAANNFVVFNVIPVSNVPYDASAFFPSFPRAQRRLDINTAVLPFGRFPIH